MTSSITGEQSSVATAAPAHPAGRHSSTAPVDAPPTSGVSAEGTRPGGDATGDDTAPMTHRQVLKAMSGLMLALLVAILSSTIVSNALPRILADLDGSESQYTWVVTAMLLTSTATTPIWGKLADLFSKKMLYQIAITIFIAGSVLGGFSQSMPMLIGFRALQGIGMGGLQALIQVVIAAMVSPRERGRYSGYTGATFAVATVSGPLIGGLIVDTPWLGWRWCFWVTVPLAVAAFLVLGRTLRLPVLKRQVKIDWFGALFLVGGVSLLLVWVSLAGKQFDWLSPQSAGFVVAGLAALAIALVIETKVREPIVPLSMFRIRNVGLAILAMVSVGTAMFGGTVFLSQYFQIARGYSPTHAGLMTLPMVLGLFLSSTISGQIISRKTGRIKPFLLLGSVMLILGMGMLSTIGPDTDLVLMGVYLACMGIGVGCMMQNLVLAVQNSMGTKNMGSATSVVTFFRTLGGSAGVSVLGAVLASRIGTYVAEGLAEMGVPAGASAAGGSSMDVGSLPGPVQAVVRGAYGDAIGDIFLIAACVSVVTLLAVLFIKEVPLRTTVEASGERADAVDNPGDSVDNSETAELAAVSSGSRSPQASGVLASAGRAGDQLVDNSGEGAVGNSAESWSTPVRPRNDTANGMRLAGNLAGPAPDASGGLYVHGTVRDSGEAPLASVVLTLTDANGRQVERAHTDEHGEYRIALANGGTYVLIVAAGQYQPSASMVVLADAPVRHDVRLLGAGGLTGAVHVDGRPVPEATAVLTDVRGEVVAAAATDPDGRYRFADLTGGSYAMTVTADGYRPVATSVVVADGEQSSVDVALRSGTQLNGVVRSANLGTPVSEARITLLDANGSVVAAATTESRGEYQFTDLPDGEYTLIATGFPPVATSLRLDGEQVAHDVDLGYRQGE